MQSAAPPRAPESAAGLAFTDTLPDGLTQEREDRIIRELLSGNVPQFMRQFTEVDASGKDSTGSERQLKLYVLSDYLCVGDDEDFVRVPLNPLSAQRVADEFGCVLPTKKMVDLVWKAASVKLEPQPIPPDSKMSTTKRFVEHNRKVQAVLNGRRGLVAGHKKDVVVTNRLLDAAGKVLHKVAIYGWQYLTGKVIQDLNPRDHDDKYADYSHGIRLVAERCELDGSLIDVRSVLTDPVLCALLTDEGPMRITAYPRVIVRSESGRSLRDVDGHSAEACKSNVVSDVHNR